MRALSVLTVLLLLQAGTVTAQETGVRARYVSEPVPIGPTDARWNKVAATTIPLLAQQMIPPQGGGSIGEVSVRGLHDGDRLALRFEWADATANRSVGVSTFRDAIAVGFPTRESDYLPSPFMGDPEHPVNIWQWTADFDANARGQGGFAERYPHTEGVWYFPQDYAVTREVTGWRGTEPVIELVATGFGTLERKVSQNVHGQSRHVNGRWQVVLHRSLSTGNPEDTLFQAGTKTHLILAVWNGAVGDVNGKKSIMMMWTPLVLDFIDGKER